MSEWKEYKLGDIATFSQGIQVAPDKQLLEQRDGYIRFIRIVDYSKEGYEAPRYIEYPGDRYVVSQDDLVMIRYGSQTAGKIVRGISGAIANNTFKIELSEHIATKDFIYYILSQQSIYDYFMMAQASSTMPAITFGMMNNLEVILPSIEDQIQITSILSSLDDKIDLLTRQNRTLEAMAETLFRQYFNEKDNDDTIEQLICIQNGYAFKSQDFKEMGTNGVVKIKNISGGVINIDTTDYIDSQIADAIHPKFRISSGDILIAMTGAEIGKLGIIPSTDKSLWLNQRVGLLAEKYKGAKYLAYLQLKSDFGQDYIENTATGSAQPNISGNGIEKCGFPKLSDSNIIEYSYQIGELYDKVIFNLGQISTLIQLRNILLPKLMNGEIIVNG